MGSGPITLWQIEGDKVETMADFLFLGSKITVNGDWSCEIKRYLLLRRKTMTNLDNLLKIRDIALPTRVRYSQSYDFSSSHVRMWELDHKKVEHQGIDTFKLWCWRRLLRVSWTARNSNQSIVRSWIFMEGLSWSWSPKTLTTWC